MLKDTIGHYKSKDVLHKYLTDLENRECEITVSIQKAKDLRRSKKKRPDNPFFYCGIGNPEHYNQDRLSRQKSGIKKSRSPEFGESFTLKLTPERELLVDIRLYSRVSGARNDFSYGVVNIPLNDLLFEKDGEIKHEIAAWYEIHTDIG
jgi:hypothetical protein